MITHDIQISADLSECTDIQTLRETVARFQRIFSSSGYGFWEWDLRTQNIDWSGGFWERLGYSKEEEKHINNANNVWEYIHPDDHQASRDSLYEHFHSKNPFSSFYRVRMKNGDYIWTQVRADSVRDENGRVLIMSGVSFDVTALKQAEEALRESEARQERIIQSSNDGIWEWYAKKGGFHFSSRCWELIGYNANDDEITRGEDKLVVWRKHIHPQDLEKFDQALADHMAGKGPFDLEYRLIGKDKQLHWVRGRGRASFNAEGKPIRMSGANMDMTQIKLAEERVIQAKVAAEKANQAKSEFLSSMSHELRTPLNAILGYAQLFEYDLNLTQQQMVNVREIRKAGDHLLQLINDVLDLAKIESGKMTVSLEPVLVSRIISEAFTLVQTQADARSIRLYATTNNLESHYVIADNVRYKQAVINLLSNAIKYNNMGGEVEVKLQTHDKLLRLIVRDNGKGIPANRQAEVFQPFNRLNAEFSKVEGSGVGLVITKQLVEMMNGCLDFYSKEDVGTEFWIDLPLATEWNQQQTEIIKSVGFTPTQLEFKQHKKVLYIEDNPTNIRLLQQFFDRHSCLSLDIAEEPFIGIYKARSNQPDLIILDINLPGMDGFEALNVLKNDPSTKHIPVVGLSANAMPYDIERGIKSGFFEYLTKPVDMNKLIETLNRVFIQ
ncbi:PAS domain-containing protein [Cellvibrio sp.]|uniref:hybrid sensor histidine kinase/response regulator n=1 Tax=Cellvibrio sp. TaxID=1965322 RepID=UPI003964859A